jgi:hypothetical protein
MLGIFVLMKQRWNGMLEYWNNGVFRLQHSTAPSLHRSYPNQVTLLPLVWLALALSVPFQNLLMTEHRLIYEHARQRLDAARATLKLADAAEAQRHLVRAPSP